MERNFAGLLRAGLSSYQIVLIRRIAAAASARSIAVYLVGGVPRDLVLYRPPGDLDLVVEGDAISLAKALATQYGGSVVAHARFGTAKWTPEVETLTAQDLGSHAGGKPKGCVVDLISARSEVYPQPAALPKVLAGSIDDDLRRRDFTINSLAIRLDGSHFGEVRDDFGALHDLEHGIIRVLHPRSFQDDPTRMYRAVRYEQRYGMNIAADTLELMAAARDVVSLLPAQRIRRELDLIFDERAAHTMLRRLSELRLLKPIHPALPANNTALDRVRLADAPRGEAADGYSRQHLRWLLWFMSLSAKHLDSVNVRLHFSRKLFAAMLAAAAIRKNLAQIRRWKPSKVTAFLRQFPLEAVYAVYLGASGDGGRSRLDKYLTVWRFVQPSITGNHLKELGLVPGRAYDYVLSNLRDARLDGLVKTPETEKQRLDNLIGRVRKSPSGLGGRKARRAHRITAQRGR